MSEAFEDRRSAGLALAERLAEEPLPSPRVVLALPRGGVPVAAEVARRLGAPLDLLLVAKIGAPWQPELAVAAVADGVVPELVVDERTSRATGADAAYIERQSRLVWTELERRRARYLGGRARVPVQGASVVLVDDGVATGTTVRAALKVLQQRGAARVLLAVPVAPAESLAALRMLCDQVVCLSQPAPFGAVGQHYRHFEPVSDEDVVAALDAAARLPFRA